MGRFGGCSGTGRLQGPVRGVGGRHVCRNLACWPATWTSTDGMGSTGFPPGPRPERLK